MTRSTLSGTTRVRIVTTVRTDVSARLRSWRSATDRLVMSKRVGAPDLGELRHRPLHRALVGRPPPIDRALGAVEHVLGELDQRRQQVVAQRAAGLRLPAIGARQGPDAVPQPHQLEPVEQRPVAGACLLRRDADALGELDHVERRVQQAPHGGTGGELARARPARPAVPSSRRRRRATRHAGSRTDRSASACTGSRKRSTSTPMSTGGRR